MPALQMDSVSVNCKWTVPGILKAGPLPCATISVLSSSFPAQSGSSITQAPPMGGQSFFKPSVLLCTLTWKGRPHEWTQRMKESNMDAVPLWLSHPSLHLELLSGVNGFNHCKNFPIPNCQILPVSSTCGYQWATCEIFLYELNKMLLKTIHKSNGMI